MTRTRSCKWRAHCDGGHQTLGAARHERFPGGYARVAERSQGSAALPGEFERELLSARVPELEPSCRPAAVIFLRRRWRACRTKQCYRPAPTFLPDWTSRPNGRHALPAARSRQERASRRMSATDNGRECSQPWGTVQRMRRGVHTPRERALLVGNHSHAYSPLCREAWADGGIASGDIARPIVLGGPRGGGARRGSKRTV